MKATSLLASASMMTLVSLTPALAGSNTIYLDQTGSGQSAGIAQSGDNNSVGKPDNRFFQQNGGGGGFNVLSVNQSGTYNTVSRNLAGYQSGTLNRADITQSGTNSNVEIQQQGSGNGTTFNNPWGFQTNKIVQDSTSNSSVVRLFQNDASSSYNSFDVIQGGYQNTTTIDQIGSGGVAYVRQGQSSPSDAYNGISIQQLTTGGQNYAVAIQYNGSSNNLALNQSGQYLAADIRQFDGNGNVALSNQSGSSNGIGAWFLGASAPFGQKGNYNQLYNTQAGYGNIVNGGQNGSYNFISTYQNNVYQTASFSQNGDWNVIKSSQDGGNNNSISVSQANNGNVSDTTQNGSNNVLTVTQN